MAARHEEGSREKNIVILFILVCRGLLLVALVLLPNGDVGVARGTVFQETRPGAGFEAGDFVEEKVWGATVERVYHTHMLR